MNINPTALFHLKLQLNPHDRITIAGVKYYDAEKLSDGYMLRTVGGSRTPVHFTHAELWDASKRRDWDHEPNYFDHDVTRVRQASRFQAFADLAAHEAAWVYHKWEYLTRFRRYEETGGTNRSKVQVQETLLRIECDIAACKATQAALARAAAKPKKSKVDPAKRRGPRKRPSSRKKLESFSAPPVRTFLRWLKNFEDAGCQPWALRDNYRAVGKARVLSPEQMEYVRLGARAYLKRRRPSFARAHSVVERLLAKDNARRPREERVACPSSDAIRRYVRGLSCFAVYAARHGDEEAKKKFILTSQGLDVVRPGQRVEIDHYEVDLESILKREKLWEFLRGDQQASVQRMQLCMALDVATNCALGAHLSETPSSADVRRIIKMVTSDKTQLAKNAGAEMAWAEATGVEAWSTDGGPALIDASVDQIIWDLGSRHEIPPGGVPWLRGTLERFFQTVHVMFLSQFDGRTFGNHLKKGSYKSKDLAHLTVDELATLLTRWIVDVYHNFPSDALGGETPRNAWIRLTEMFDKRPLPSKKKFMQVFGENLTRKLSGSGLKVLGNFYIAPELGQLFLYKGKIDVDIRLDTTDLGAIAYRVGENWLEARCRDSKLDGVSVETWARTIIDLRLTRTAQAQEVSGIVHRALDAIEAEADASRARANIATPTLTAADIAKLENDVFIGFTMPEPVDPADPAGDEDILSTSFETGAGTPSWPAEIPEAGPAPSASPDADDPDDDDFSFVG